MHGARRGRGVEGRVGSVAVGVLIDGGAGAGGVGVEGGRGRGVAWGEGVGDDGEAVVGGGRGCLGLGRCFLSGFWLVGLICDTYTELVLQVELFKGHCRGHEGDEGNKDDEQTAGC